MYKNTPTVLAYDLGTGGVKASLVSSDCRVICDGFSAYKTYCDADGRREQRPDDWWNAVICATKQMLSSLGSSPDIRAIAISGHSMGRVAVDRNGALLEEYTPIWSDSRAEYDAESFFSRVDYKKWYEATGSGSPPCHYAMSKIMRLKRVSPEIYGAAYKFLGTKDYINMKLTGATVTDFSYASGSGLYDLVGGTYREDFIKAADIDASKLPEIKRPTDTVGYVTEAAAKELGIAAGIPVAAGGIDNGCMALGAGCLSEGDTYCSLGSSSWIATASEKTHADVNTRPYIFAHCIEGLYLPHQGIFSSGTSHDWVLRTLFSDLDESTKYEEFDAFAKRSPVGANKLLFCPALAGGSAADPSPSMRGGFSGLDLSHTREDIARATVEGVALQLRYVSSSLFDRQSKLILTGGGSKSRFWRQVYADVFGTDTLVSPITRGTATLGAAALALVASGLSNDLSCVKNAIGSYETTHNIPENTEYYNKIFPRFERLMKAMASV